MVCGCDGVGFVHCRYEARGIVLCLWLWGTEYLIGGGAGNAVGA